ncbi:MAG: hypothetical protein JKY54_10375 [Flavobacteriales bacterium]|nr:hypothetical protein [Flavobacteriales bacterium]
MEFPQYRKYSNDKGFFKVISLEEFEEIQLIGSKAIRSDFLAKTFLDRYLIQDMLDCKDGRWEVIGEKEYLLHVNVIRYPK